VTPRRHARVHTPGASPAATGFTLVEMIVVMIVLSVLAAVVVPRVAGLGVRQAEAEVRQAQDMLTLAAEKAAALNAPAAIDYADKTLTLYTFRMKADPSGNAAADLSIEGAGAGKWTPDPLANPLRLSRVTVDAARLDGVPLPAGKPWRITFSPGQARPGVEFDLKDDSSRTWTLRLESDATQTTASRAGQADAGSNAAPRRSIDLDDAGRGTAKW